MIAIGTPAETLSIAADSWAEDEPSYAPPGLSPPAPVRDALLADEQVYGPGFGALGLASDVVLATPITKRNGNHTVLFVSCAEEPRPELQSKLRALCEQLALAIEESPGAGHESAGHGSHAEQRAAA